MATVTTNVYCDGIKLNVHSLSVDQKINWHHSFRIAVASESLEGKKAVNIDNSVEFLGKIVDIGITSRRTLSGDGLNFKGIVTSVHIDRTFTEDNLIIISGYSPTYLLEDGLGCQSFEEKKGDQIFKSVVANYPANLLNPSAGGNYSSPIPYMVRYKETNFQFLNRLAAMYGEWFYYTGQNLIYGQIQETNQVEISLGTDLQSYEYGVTMKPANFDWLSYDYTKNNQLSKSSNSYKPTTLNTYSKKALDVASKSFAGGHKIPTMYDIKEERQLKERIEISKTNILSDTSTFSGQSTNPSLTIGTNLSVFANNSTTGVFKKVFINRFRVIGVQHHVNQNNDYQNNFEALPFECTLPPVNPNVFKPEAESQIAVVKENNDPQSLGRVRVQFNWQSGNEMTPWIRVSTAHASVDRGFYFTPEIDDQVMVDFEHGNPNRPYIINSMYHSQAKPEFFDPDNNFKSIKTRSGHTILFNDTSGKESITIKDKKGNRIKLNTASSSISISTPGTLSLSSKNMKTNVKEDMEIKVEGNMKTEVDIDQENFVRGNMENLIVGDAKYSSSQNTEIEAYGNLSAKSLQNVEINGLNIEVKGKASAKMSGPQTEVKGTATLNLEAAGITTIKGLPVKIN